MIWGGWVRVERKEAVVDGPNCKSRGRNIDEVWCKIDEVLETRWRWSWGRAVDATSTKCGAVDGSSGTDEDDRKEAVASLEDRGTKEEAESVVT
ncbi:hypothetical protein L1887_01203 [Cichorium endivia]|nr:hypothetical protein L1887_01203 [Cichorium endivia]